MELREERFAVVGRAMEEVLLVLRITAAFVETPS
jgi:hypothetical protein